MIPHDSDRKKPPLALRNGQCGAQDPEETGSYPPSANWPPAATVAGGRATSHERVDILASPQAAGESAGWPIIAFSGCWARVVWALSSWPKTVFSPDPLP